MSYRINNSLRRWIVRHYRDPHEVLVPLMRAYRSSTGCKFYRVPMPLPHGIKNSKLRYFFLIFWHLSCSFTWRGERAIVREFLTIPLLLCAPFLFFRRRYLWFLIQHNLQRASTSKVEKCGLKILSYLGFQFLLYEDVSSWFAVIGGTRTARVAKISMPSLSLGNFNCSNYRSKIGIVGNFRPEKNPEAALEALEAGGLADKIILGTSDATLIRKWQNRVEVVNTRQGADYWRCLRQCKMVVLSYRENDYYWRSSGVISDAIAAGAFVVCPNYPILSKQINSPYAVGVTYKDHSELPEIVSKLSDRDFDEDMRLQFIQSRSPLNVAHDLYFSLRDADRS